MLIEIKKSRKQLEKKQITYGQVDNLILMVAKKYDALEKEDALDDRLPQIDFNIQPEIVLSETFID